MPLALLNWKNTSDRRALGPSQLDKIQVIVVALALLSWKNISDRRALGPFQLEKYK